MLMGLLAGVLRLGVPPGGAPVPGNGFKPTGAKAEVPIREGTVDGCAGFEFGGHDEKVDIKQGDD